MDMNRKTKKIWAAVLGLALLFTQLPFSQLSSVGTALAEEELLQGKEITKEEAEAELLGGSVPSVVFTYHDRVVQYTESSLPGKFAYLDGLDKAIAYLPEEKKFRLEKPEFVCDISFTGGMKCTLDLGSGCLKGSGETSTVKIGKNCKVTISSQSRLGAVSSQSALVGDEGGLIHNRGEVILSGVNLRGGDSSLRVSYDGGALINYGTAVLQDVRISRTSAAGDGGAVYNKGTLIIKNVSISGCDADGSGKEICNAGGGTVLLSGKLTGTKAMFNAGTIRCDGAPSLANTVSVPVENTASGTVESGAFSNTVSGGNIEAAGENVKFVLEVNKGKQYLLPAGTEILALMKQHAYIMEAVFPEDGGRAVTEADKVDPLNQKTRKVTATVGITVSFETGYEVKLESRKVAMGTRIEKPELTREDYWLKGWYTDADFTQEFDFSKPVTENVKLYAYWIPKAVITVEVDFESCGGSAVDSQRIVAGDKASKPVDPVRTDHLFSGWFTDAACRNSYDFDRPVVADMKLYAGWQLKPVTKVKVTFVPGNGTAETEKTVLLNDPVEKPADPVRYGYTFRGWFRDPECTNQWEFFRAVAADMHLYAGWTALPKYTVSFESNGGSAVASQTVMQTEKAVKPADPVKALHRFAGWCTEKECRNLYDFDTAVSKDVKLYALWLEEAVVPVKVSFETLGGSTVPQQVLLRGDKAEKPEDPVKKNYTFGGWYTDREGKNPYDFSAPVNEDITLTALWTLTPVVAVHVTFEAGDGSAAKVKTIFQNEKAAEPDAPVRREYFFTGWYSDSSCTQRWDFDTAVSEDITLYAGWKAKKRLTVTFDSLGGSAVEAKTVLEQDPVEEPAAKPVKENFLFFGWCTEESCRENYDFSTPVSADRTLYACWIREAVIPVRVSFETNGGTAVGAQVLAWGDKAVKPEDPVREFYLFAGWYSDAAMEEAYDFDSPVTEDTVLYAQWLYLPVSKVCVTFEYQNGEDPVQETVLAGDPVEEPANPTWDGHVFLGWYADPECTKLWDFRRGVVSDCSIYAGWREKEQYTVRFEDPLDQDRLIASVTVTELDTVSPPAAPVKEKYRFIGWTAGKTGRELYDFERPVTGNMTLYAYWLQEAVVPVYITFDSNGGTPVGQQVVASGSNAVKPADPARSGYRFAQWLKKAEGTAFDFTAKLTEDIELIAEWLQDTVIPVWLRFDTAGGSQVAPVTVVCGTNAEKPAQNPVKKGYRFTGWFEDKACTAVFDFDHTLLTEDRTVYAGWKELATYRFRFDSCGGTDVPAQTVYEGGSAVQPEAPEKEGYFFLFWCTDQKYSQVYDFSAPVMKDTVVYAKWLAKSADTVTVSFDSCGGTAVEAQKVVRGEKAVKPVDPARNSYSFRGWFTDAACTESYDFSAKVTGDLQLYAGWTFSGGGGGGGGGGGSSSGSRAVSFQALDAKGNKLGTWKQDAKGWWIEKTDGTWPHDEWVNCTWNGVLNWYFFTPEGYMASGFITGKDGRKYYLHTAATGSAGTMAAGWVQIEGKWYCFNPNSDGTMGAMLVNTTTPDGYKVGADGVWVR